MLRQNSSIEGFGTLSSSRFGVRWTGRYRVAATPTRNAPHRTYGAFETDDEIDLRFLDAFIAGADLMLTLEDGRTVTVKVGGLGSRRLVLIGATRQ
jgi:hypothetical protein